MIFKSITTFIALIVFLPALSWSQLFETDRYEFGLSPDLWYNSVDGVQVGIMGGMREHGRIQEGPHFIDYGLMLGTRYPDITLHYRFNYRHTLISRGEFERLSGNLRSFRRDGFQQHGAGLNWNQRFGDDQLVWRVDAQYYAHEIYDDRYQLYQHLWNEGWTDIVRLRAGLTNWGDLHRNSSVCVDARLSPGTLDTDSFARVEGTAQHRFRFADSFGLNIRGYAGWVSEASPSTYHLGFAGASLIDFQDSRLTRARGTLPPSWTKNGLLHKSGGANIRGFQEREARQRDVTDPAAISSTEQVPLAPLTEAAFAFNTELEVPNPVNSWLKSFPVVGEFIQFSSYLFNDTGAFMISEDQAFEDTTLWLINAGAGFELSVNVPDYLGRKRGFQLRFDLPFWFFDSNANESQFELRPLIGLGSIYNF